MRKRGFTMVEVAAVAGVVAIASAVAVIGITAALDSSRREARLQAVFEDLGRRRAAHLGRSNGPEACLHVQQTGRTFEFTERSDCAVPAAGEAPAATRYDVVSVQVTDDGAPTTSFCIDPLARPRNCAAGDGAIIVYTDIAMDIDADRTVGKDGTIRWTSGGRLSATFSKDIDASAQPYLTDVSASTTPNPTHSGGFAGVPTDPQGLLE